MSLTAISAAIENQGMEMRKFIQDSLTLGHFAELLSS